MPHKHRAPYGHPRARVRSRVGTRVQHPPHPPHPTGRSLRGDLRGPPAPPKTPTHLLVFALPLEGHHVVGAMLVGPAAGADAGLLGAAEAVEGLEVAGAETLLQPPQRGHQAVGAEGGGPAVGLQVGPAERSQANQARPRRRHPRPRRADVAQHRGSFLPRRILLLGSRRHRGGAGGWGWRGWRGQSGGGGGGGCQQRQHLAEGAVLAEPQGCGDGLLAERAASSPARPPAAVGGARPLAESPQATLAEVMPARYRHRVLQEVEADGATEGTVGQARSRQRQP